MSIKPRTEKRTTTQQGLGKVAPPEPRRTSKRERIDGVDASVGSSETGISAPPPSGAPVSRGGARMTRSLERAEPVENADDKADKAERPSKQAHDDRAEPGDVRSDRGRRTPIEVTQVDTKRLVKPTKSVPPPRSSPSAPTRSAPPSSAGSRSSAFGSEEIATGRRPIAGRSASARPASTPSPASVQATAATPQRRGNRMSIREDNFGASVMRAPNAIGTAGRIVPKVVKTRAEIAAAPIDHRAGFLIAHIDGVTTVQGLVDIAGMPEEEVQEILERLRRLGIVTLR